MNRSGLPNLLTRANSALELGGIGDPEYSRPQVPRPGGSRRPVARCVAEVQSTVGSRAAALRFCDVVGRWVAASRRALRAVCV